MPCANKHFVPFFCILRSATYSIKLWNNILNLLFDFIENWAFFYVAGIVDNRKIRPPPPVIRGFLARVQIQAEICSALSSEMN